MLQGNFLFVLSGCFFLGILHGIIPDEHTWPITFSYSVGSATGKGGMLAALFFSSSFTLQRAVMSELAYLAIISVLDLANYINYVYIAVGIAMSAAGYLLIRNRLPHWHPLMWVSTRDKMRHLDGSTGSTRVPVHWTLIHGFIAGFGVDTGLFTTFVYLVAVPSMPAAFLGFLPGALFGLGTMFVLVLIGLIFGTGVNVARRFGVRRIEFFSSLVASRSLFVGGLLFIAGGIYESFVSSTLLGLDIGNVLILSFVTVVVVPVVIKSWFDSRKSIVAP